MIFDYNFKSWIIPLETSFEDFKSLGQRSSDEVLHKIASSLLKYGVTVCIAFSVASRLAFLEKHGLAKGKFWIWQLADLKEDENLTRFILRAVDNSSEKGERLYNGLEQLSRKKGIPAMKQLKKLGKDAGLTDPDGFASIFGSTFR